ncbi:MAG: helix-turn-helix domain-containing protein [Phycisphaeraceae bacterium]
MPAATAKRPSKGPARIYRVRQKYGLPQAKFSRVVGVSTRTLAKLEHGEQPSEQVRRQVTEVERLYRALAEVVQEDAIGPWMEEPNEAFGRLKPLEVIERGEIDRLWAMIYDLRSGSPT